MNISERTGRYIIGYIFALIAIGMTIGVFYAPQLKLPAAFCGGGALFWLTLCWGSELPQTDLQEMEEDFRNQDFCDELVRQTIAEYLLLIGWIDEDRFSHYKGLHKFDGSVQGGTCHYASPHEYGEELHPH